MNFMTIGEKIANLVQKSGITQAELARAVGTYPSRMSDWANDRGMPNLKVGLRIARALGVSLDYLADDDQVEIPTTADEWEGRILEIARQIGPKRAWRRLVEFDERFSDTGAVEANPDKTKPEQRTA